MTTDARRTAERERVEEACRALLSSEGWRRWVRARSAFHTYSLNNQLLIVLQSPNATRVAGFHTWRKLGRQVRKGEKSIRILAPLLIRENDLNAERTSGNASDDGPEQATEQLVGYRYVGIFDLTQTDPIPGADPLPLEPPSAPISGDSHAHFRSALVQHATSLGYTVRYETTDGCDGYCDRASRRIAVSAALPPNAQVRILIHECCHARGADYETYDRAACEVIVDCATHIACSTIGLDVSGETIPYITGWGDAHGALAAVTTFAGVIDDLAARIETVLTPSACAADESPLAVAPAR